MSLSKVLQLSSFTMPFAGTWVTIGGNSAEIVPLMKTNWRNQGSFLLPSQEANPNNMKLPKPRFSFAQKGLKIHGKDNACKKSQVRINTIQLKEKKASTITINHTVVHTRLQSSYFLNICL